MTKNAPSAPPPPDLDRLLQGLSGELDAESLARLQARLSEHISDPTILDRVVGARFAQLRKEHGFSQAEVARRIGVKQQSIQQLEAGRVRQPRYLAEAAKLFGVSHDWLATGEGPRRRTAAPVDGLATIPEIDPRLDQGGGGEALIAHTPGTPFGAAPAAIKARWTLPTRYLETILGTRAGAAVIMEMVGDSMAPTLDTGAHVLVDLDDRNPSPPGLFALFDGIGIVCKRLEPVLDRKAPTLRIASDNERHGAYERAPSAVRIIGRIVWTTRRL